MSYFPIADPDVNCKQLSSLNQYLNITKKENTWLNSVKKSMLQYAKAIRYHKLVS